VQRRRRNDPAGVSDNPIFVSDPLREAAVIARFKRGLGYIEQHYLIAKRLGLDKRTFNESLARLQAAVACPRQVGAPESRLSPCWKSQSTSEPANWPDWRPMPYSATITRPLSSRLRGT